MPPSLALIVLFLLIKQGVSVWYASCGESRERARSLDTQQVVLAIYGHLLFVVRSPHCYFSNCGCFFIASVCFLFPL